MGSEVLTAGCTAGGRGERRGRVRRGLGWGLLLAGLALLGVGLRGEREPEEPTTPAEPPVAMRAERQAAKVEVLPKAVAFAGEPEARGPGHGLRRIEAMRLGQRVLGRNPLRAQVDEGPKPQPARWRQIDLEMVKGNGRRLYASLLREVSWLEEEEARVGGRVWLDLPEMGAQGWATVTGISACPEIERGEGSVVTGLFRHEPDGNLVDVRVAGMPDPIGCTDNHPFWSEDRGVFVAAGKLRRGERLRVGELGELASVMLVTPRPREAWVYNLEVQGEHVY